MSSNGQRPPLCGLEDTQVDALGQKLDPAHVKLREGKFSYIEGHHAIREANRIFGPAGWTRDSSDMRLVHEGEYRGKSKGGQEKVGSIVCYVCRVTVRARCGDDCSVASDGWGYGESIGYANIGQCHEKAIKEAETDAMKRALVKFGDPFGLALYDNEQENVATPEEVAQAQHFDAEGRPIDLDGLGVALVAKDVAEEGVPKLSMRAAKWLEITGAPPNWTPENIGAIYDKALDIHKSDLADAEVAKAEKGAAVA